MTLLTDYLHQPRGLWLRRALFQIHLWSGLGLGLYLVAISLSGSVLVYRSELRQAFDPQPRVVEPVGARLSMDELTTVVERAYPDHRVSVWTNPDDPTHAVTMAVERDGVSTQYLFDPYRGEDLGHALPFGWRATTWLLDLHDNLLSGESGRAVNGVGALVLALLTATGVFVWWPGLRRWRRALGVDTTGSWRRLIWTLHGAVGLWTAAFLLMWGVTGIYLSFPAPFTAFVDSVEPLDLETFEPRVGDAVLYWLASLHFGRFGGSVTKLVWAFVGLVPVVMLVTGVVMWWNRVLRRQGVLP